MPDGTPVDLYTLTNSNGLVARITNYGTIITQLHVPDRSGKMVDVVLGFDNLNQYLKGHPYFGCTVGRFANRIAKGKFTLDGKTYAGIEYTFTLPSANPGQPTRTIIVENFLMRTGSVLKDMESLSSSIMGARGQAAFGMACFLGIAAALSTNLRAVNRRTIKLQHFKSNE